MYNPYSKIKKKEYVYKSKGKSAMLSDKSFRNPSSISAPTIVGVQITFC